MKKEVKDTIIAELGQKLQEFPHFYLVDVTGLNAEKTSALRRKCFQSEIKMVVVKNSLLHKAFEASDIDFSDHWHSSAPVLCVKCTEVNVDILCICLFIDELLMGLFISTGGGCSVN